MTRFLFIRHAATLGNLERRYIGRTDEPVCGVASLDCTVPDEFTLYVSPMLRCRQTASMLFPDVPQTVVDALRETDFGMFEGKTADELSDCPEYSAWLDTGCEGDIPGGDSIAAFKERCCCAFLDIAATPGGLAVVVTHGGVIMSILERFGHPRRGFYDWHIPNCGHISASFKNGRLLTE